MDVQQYFDQLNDLYIKLYDFIANDDDDEKDYFNELLIFLEKHKISEDPYEFKSFLHLISNISNNHRRTPHFFAKFDRILFRYKDNIKKTFSNFSIFNIFKDNKRILFFLFTNEIVTLDDTISQFIHEENISTFSFSDKKFIEKNDDDEFMKKCQNGENDSYLCQLIRDDLVDDFIVYINKNNLSLFRKIEPSIFETNLFLIQNKPSLIEYATFYGSVQIFQYLRFSEVELDSSLWLYAIHSMKGEIIHLLEENLVQPPKNNFDYCLIESIKCHHHDITNYILESSITNYKNIDLLICENCFKYRDYSLLSQYFGNRFYLIILKFQFFCEFDYITIVKHFLQDKKIKNNLEYLGNKFISSASLNNNSEIVYLIIQACGKLINSDSIIDFNKLRELTIPSSVTRIGDYFFDSTGSLTTISLPSSVKYIGKAAFNNCSSLREITIPPFVKKIEEYTFNMCNSLRKIIIPNSLTSIGEYAFNSCFLLEIISIPSSVTSIGRNAFYDCKSLKKINLPSGLEIIETSLFFNCKMLEEITIPPLITEIGAHSFENCTSLKKIIFQNDQSKSFTSTFNHLFSKIFPNYSSIKTSAFKKCTSLEQISIPPMFRKINDEAFSECISLSQIDLPSTILFIGSSTFYKCSSLKRIDIPPLITSINDSTFKECSSLEHITIPPSIKSIGPFAFYGCSSFKEIILPSSISEIEVGAFYKCILLEKITIPSPLVTIGSEAFHDCDSLTDFYISSSNTNLQSTHTLNRASIKPEIIHFIDQ